MFRYFILISRYSVVAFVLSFMAIGFVKPEHMDLFFGFLCLSFFLIGPGLYFFVWEWEYRMASEERIKADQTILLFMKAVRTHCKQRIEIDSSPELVEKMKQALTLEGTSLMERAKAIEKHIKEDGCSAYRIEENFTAFGPEPYRESVKVDYDNLEPLWGQIIQILKEEKRNWLDELCWRKQNRYSLLF